MEKGKIGLVIALIVCITLFTITAMLVTKGITIQVHHDIDIPENFLSREIPAEYYESIKDQLQRKLNEYGF